MVGFLNQDVSFQAHPTNAQLSQQNAGRLVPGQRWRERPAHRGCELHTFVEAGRERDPTARFVFWIGDAVEKPLEGLGHLKVLFHSHALRDPRQ